MKTKILSFIFFSFLSSITFAQVKIGSTGAPNVNAVLELDGGTNKGFLMPRLTATQMGAMTTSPDGMMIYNITDKLVYIRKDNIWRSIIDIAGPISLTLPFNGSGSTTGNNLFSITQFGTSGTAAYFTGGDDALRTGLGTVKLNEVGGNTAIGMPAGAAGKPTLAKLVVRGMVGNTAAIFGDNVPGVSIENNFPGISFNAYYNSGSKALVGGYASRMSLNTTTGLFSIYSTTTSGASGVSNDAAMTPRLTILSNGNIGIEGNTNPQALLSFGGSLGKKISMYRGATGDAGFGVYPNELRMNSDYNNADITFGYDDLTSGFTERVRMKANGNMGIGIPSPTARLDVNGRMRIRRETATYGSGIYIDGPSGNQNAFIGMETENVFGFYSNNRGWIHHFNLEDGVVRLGTTQAANGYLLNVGGRIIAEEVRVQLRASWPDYVFANNYKLTPLNEVEKFIQQNKHLPNMPSASEIETTGQELGEIQRKLLEKVEELTLYVIDLKKEIEILKNKKTD